MTVIENARVNAEHTFDSIAEVLEAESTGDSLRIQRDALGESIERNLSQVREVPALAANGAKHGVEPIGEYLTEVRGRAMSSDG